MGNTPIYGFGYIEPNQDLSENIDLDELRFKAIENQTYNLYQIFKNGILEQDPLVPSWRIQTFSDEFKLTKLTITSGKGHVSFKYAVTTSSKVIDMPVLPSNIGISRIFVYAYENENTSVTGDVDFIASLTQISDSSNYIYLGYVDVDVVNNLVSLNDFGRQNISLFSSLSASLLSHRHIGGSANPSPIDLATEVKNGLTSNNITHIDAAKITSGIIDSARLPKISHTTLEDVGNLTHTELETMLLDVVNQDSTFTLADLSIANRLQLLLSLKKQTGFGFTYVDSSQINTIVYVPGIFPNNQGNSSIGNTANFAQTTSIPSQYTLASIGQSTIRTSGSGISNSVTSSTYVSDKRFASQSEFLSAKTLAISIGSSQTFFNNILISGSATTGSFTIDNPLNYKTVLNPVTSIFDTTNDWYSGLVFNTTFSSNKVKINTKMYSYTLFDNPLSFEEVSRIGIGFSAGLGESTATLGSIYMFLVTGVGNTDPGLLYDEKVEFSPSTTGTGATILYVTPVNNVKIFDETITGQTGGTNTYSNILLSNFGDSTLTKSVKGLGFYFSSDNGWNPEKQIVFKLQTPTEAQINLDSLHDSLISARRNPTDENSSVFVWNEKYKYKNGSFLLRFDSGDVNTQYNLLEYDVNIPSGTKYTVTTRSNISSDTFYNIRNANTSDIVQANVDSSSSTGRYLDVLFSLYSNEDQDLAPIVNSLRINYSAVGSATSRSYDRNLTDSSLQKSGWISDVYYNKNVGYGITNSDGTNYLNILSTSSVGNWIYLKNNALISAATNVSETTIEDGIDSGDLRSYLSPVQIFQKASQYGFNGPTDYQALDNGGNIICDTKNDRIVITDINGNFTKIIQGNIRLKLIQRDFVALSASYNPTNRKIYIAFSQNVSFVDKTKIYITYDNITLRGDDTRLDGEYFDPIFGLSSTYVFTIKNTVEGLALNSSLQNSTNKKIRLDKGSFTNSGNSVNSSDTLTATIPVTATSTTNRTQQFYAGINTSISGTQSITTGLTATTTIVSDVTDFNGDTTISATTMYGPNSQVDDILLDIIQGPVYFANIYNPVSVQYEEVDNLIVVSQSHSNSVLCFSDDSDLTLKWAINSSVVKYYDNKLGSAYLMGNGNVLLGSPAVDTLDTGKLLVYNLSNGFIETKLTFNNDVIKALPGTSTDYSTFYVLTDDVINNGENSRLHLVNTSGTIISTWGDNNEIFHPKGMRVVSGDNILISE